MLDIYKKIEEVIEAERQVQLKERGGKERTTWYPSEIGGCLRGAYAKRLGIIPDKELDERTKRVFKCGNMFEDFILDLIGEDEEYTLEREVRVEDNELHFSGRIDALITYKDGTKEALEIKSKHSGAFHYMKKTGKPMRQHEYQLWLYLYHMGIEKGRLVYLSKDDLCIATFEVRLDDEQLKKEVLWKLGLLNEAWEKKDPSILPLIEDEKDWRAKYCDYHEGYCKKI